MSVRLKKGKSAQIHVLDMRDGQIAIIREWAESKEHINKVVQRSADILITIGKSSGYNWSSLFTPKSKEAVDLRDMNLFVELLEEGDILEIMDN